MDNSQISLAVTLPPAIYAKLLLSGEEAQSSKERKRLNQLAQEQFWDKEHFPHWKKCWSWDYAKPYYWNICTGQPSWQLPIGAKHYTTSEDLTPPNPDEMKKMFPEVFKKTRDGL